MPHKLNNTITVEALRRSLKDKEQSYLLFSNLPASRAKLQFEGVLNNKAVVWDACVRTIDDYALNNEVAPDPKQIINVAIVNGRYKLEVALHMKQIDSAVLERTIIMIRKYKALKVGFHEYGARSKLM